MMKIRYFAWLRDDTGCGQEEMPCPRDVNTINDLVDFLSQQDEKYKRAFARKDVIRVALNHEFASFDDAISDQDEIAFFPPVTGG